MELINSTRMAAAYTMGVEPSGRELLVVVVKGTFAIPNQGESVRLADEQVPLVMADTYTGEPGFSAPLCEADFSPRKPHCDILLNGSAYAVGGRPTTRVTVGLRVGAVTKSFAVVGNRHWRYGVSGISASAPEPFTTMPISYDGAFGGVDNRHEDPMKHAAFGPNPVGRGYHAHLRREWVDGSPLPNTEELHRPIDTPNSTTYVPMSFGPVGRGWERRRQFAGTYDDVWREEHFPFLPPDFDERYFQAAPFDQQLRHPLGVEEIRLVNLSPEGDISFQLPVFAAPIHFFPRSGKREDGRLNLDTILLEPDKRRFTLTWRVTRTLKKNMFEIDEIMVGKRSQAWWSKRQTVGFPAPEPVAVENDATGTEG